MRWYDDRYRGNHGIARFAREVTAGLAPVWQPIDLGGTPTSPADTMNVRRMRLPRNAVLYSPGFGTGPARCIQVLTVHDLIHLRFGAGTHAGLQRQWYDRVLRPVVLRAGHVVTVSKTSADELSEWLGDSVQVHNVGNGCSSAFTPDGPRQIDPEPYVLYVGNVKEHKNAEVAFAAVAQVEGVKLRVVSTDAQGVAVLAATYGVTDRTIVESSIDDTRLAELYRGAAALLMPSLWEGFGLPALEALRCGTAVIYYAGCASVSEICGDSGLAFTEPNAFAEIAHHVDALTRTERRPSLPVGHASRYTWESVNSRLREVLAMITND